MGSEISKINLRYQGEDKATGDFIGKPDLILFNLSRIRTNKWNQIY